MRSQPNEKGTVTLHVRFQKGRGVRGFPACKKRGGFPKKRKFGPGGGSTKRGGDLKKQQGGRMANSKGKNGK